MDLSETGRAREMWATKPLQDFGDLTKDLAFPQNEMASQLQHLDYIYN